MSAQSKAMYWQARAMELEAMVEKMAEAINDYLQSHGCIGNRINLERLYEVRESYAAMKGGK